MFKHVDYLQFQAKPEKPDAFFAAKLQELVGGQFGEMTVMMQYLWQGWSCRVPGKYKDMIMDIATEEIGHVEMLTTMLARLLEGAPAEATEKAAAANPLLAAVLGGQNPQHAIVTGGGAMPTNSQGVPWNAGYIVASGNLLADFRSNVAAEAQSRLQTSRIYNMTDDRGVKDMLQFNLARDTYHQQQWLLGIEQLIADGFTENGIEDSNAEFEHPEANHTFYSFDPESTAGEGRWARGPALNGKDEIIYVPDAQPLTDDRPLGPAPDPKLFVTYDGSMGKGKPGTGAGAHAQGVANVVNKIKGAVTD
ncbi:manganese catalase family protein [Actinoplanes xinjiangensis]|jgi:Mn-containing catalase|uniref:Mn-containing catalase n=1 Tax=Actinoplanes xinjiangensis TaxID=512350 RepID=A0A316FHN9_9ACTN|nr:manganese catalase family protein [Actinoplanes xinjiangensis]PWK47236.1 Mn-containing catalase [Actinoplanes xinjiangensis]GIF40394.1 Mn-containing catalase [Actinoplanes xinjiangensis]